MANLIAGGVSVPVVDIDNSGTFKYVLLKVKKAVSTNKENATYLVRGHSWADYHADLVEECERQIRDKNMQVECVGGGRIRHDRDRKHIIVYGYSVGYGQAKHAVACDILKTYYHDYTIEWNNDGY